ncbi:four helix bundle protein [Roseimicrobium gellanilyticum]|uniref:Four helix bundle protein n=1 Tax=Roseimicrobium gellanilyticum TaxID=748857 RepID=A0A366HNQ2_9BACT|nr:four helix bundle protein [Roseimicrobium gellanilyticum]
MARGSLYETQTQTELSREFGFVSPDDSEQVLNLCNEIERMLNALIARLGS